MYSCIIIDDEQYAVDGLKKYIDSVPNLRLVQSYTDPTQALQINDGDDVDIIFIDINMPKINGIELSKIIRNKTKKLIFTTAYVKYAYDAFEVEADAYLLKPYTVNKFINTVNRLLPEKSEKLSGLQSNDFFFVKSKDDNLKIVRIRYDEIIAVESKLNYILIHTKDKKILTYMQLIDIAKILTLSSGFVQLHRSYLVNQNYIEIIDGNTVKMSNGLELTVGDVYRKEFSSFVSGNLINTGKRK